MSESKEELVCSCCDKAWGTSKNKKIHESIRRRMEERGPGKRYMSAAEAANMVCACCNRSWSRRRDLEVHLKTKKVTGEPRKVHKPRSDKLIKKCEFCDESFDSPEELHDHVEGN